jgi:hypothetical protein
MTIDDLPVEIQWRVRAAIEVAALTTAPMFSFFGFKNSKFPMDHDGITQFLEDLVCLVWDDTEAGTKPAFHASGRFEVFYDGDNFAISLGLAETCVERSWDEWEDTDLDDSEELIGEVA